jgi:hypothetical protein
MSELSVHAARVESNGTAKRPARKPAPERQPSSKARGAAAAARQAVRWSHRYTAAAVVLSCGLNGYASAQAAQGALAQGVGATLGAAVPLLVWLLAQVTAWTYRSSWRRWALLPGAVSCALLALSVTHCAAAFAALTGTSWFLSGCLAVGIDCGLVSSEATAILVSSVE